MSTRYVDHSYSHGGSSARAFTLVELLVVVAIIVILIAILLPSLGRAKAHAQKAACAANLKQLGTAFLVFATEHVGTLPGTQTAGYKYPDEWKNDWLAGDWPSGDVNDGKPGFYRQPQEGTIFPYVKGVMKAYRCPSLYVMPLKSKEGSNGRFDYTFAQCLNGAKVINVKPMAKVSYNGRTVELPSPMVMEESPACYLNNGWTDSAWCVDDEITYNHLGGTNICSFDGSTVWYKPDAGFKVVAENVQYRAPSGRWVSPDKDKRPFGWLDQQ